MVEQVESLKDRYTQLERRKRSETEGYQADIKLLRQKVKQVEQQLVRASIAKAKGKDKLSLKYSELYLFLVLRNVLWINRGDFPQKKRRSKVYI